MQKLMKFSSKGMQVKKKNLGNIKDSWRVQPGGPIPVHHGKFKGKFFHGSIYHVKTDAAQIIVNGMSN